MTLRICIAANRLLEFQIPPSYHLHSGFPVIDKGVSVPATKPDIDGSTQPSRFVTSSRR